MNTSFAHRRVLILDDEPAVIYPLKDMILRKLGCIVREVNSSEAGLAALEAEHFDVLITDMKMPGLHGIELLQRVVADHPNLRIIVMTGYAEDFPYVAVIETGAADFVAKPFHPVEMQAKLVNQFRLLQQFEQYDTASRITASPGNNGATADLDIKYRKLFEANMQGMVLARPENLEILECNPAFCSMVGMDAGHLVGISFLDILDDSSQMRFNAAFNHFIQTRQGALAGVGLKGDDAALTYLDLYFSFFHHAGEDFLCVLVNDISDKQEVQRQLAEIATTDSLTGLQNRRTFRSKLVYAINCARRNSTSAALVLIDLDNFKLCNDTYGHRVGDELLRGVGQNIRKHIRANTDAGYRFGGDEFAVVLCDSSLEGARLVAERIRTEFERGENYGASMSIGVAQLLPDMSVDAFVSAADEALYKAKNSGKNTVFVI